MKKVIDVSSYNSVVDWKSAKKQGVDGAILKIIRKDLTRDNQFNSNYKGCESEGIPWGVYNYSYATTVSKAQSDMKLVCDVLDGLSKKYFTLGVWFDIEDKVQASLSKSAIAKIINAAQKVVEGRGYQFGVYTGLAYYKEHMDIQTIDCKRWWIARYYKGYDAMKFETDPNETYKPLSDCWAWQYTSSGTFSPKICSGNSGNVDLSVLYEESKEETAMTIKIGSARIDERGKTSGGAVGDQKQTSSTNDTKGEVSMQNFYVHSKGWYIFRPKDAAIATKIASAMKTACNNANIGYDQGNRLGVIKYGTATKTKTECDCSSLVRQCVKEASGKDPGNFTTANEPEKLKASGLFESKIAYTSGTKLYTGDVLVTKTKGHTVIVVEGYARTGSSASTSAKKTYSGTFPALPPRGYYKLGDGYKTLTNYTTQIKRLQKLLNWILDLTLTVDGDYGKKTAEAVATFQKKYSLTVDKEFGQKSLAKAKTIKK